jgi:transcriptional regulator with XRE-family HTH domain
MGTPARIPEVWMKLHNRKLLLKLMAIQEVSARQLARQAGWSSHSFMNRLLRGDVDTLSVEPAVRIARYLGVGTDDLFATRVSIDSSGSAKRGKAA